MSGTDWTTTPNHGFYLPIYDADEGTWGTHLNDNTTALDTLLATTGTTTFLPINGGTMNGKLTLFSPPSAAMDAATKGYVDGLLTGAPFMPLSGGTMTGMLTLFSDPAGALDAVTKQYADGMLPLAGGTVTGATTFSAAGTALTVTNNASIGGTLTATGGIAVPSMTTSMTTWLNSLPTAPQVTKQWWNNGGSPVYS
jgi:hypothetical protein